MNLFSDIATWDKKSVGVIIGIYNRYSAEPEFVEQIVSLTANEKLQSGSTWLLKHYLERHKQPIARHLVEAIYLHLDKLGEWEAKLHVLQCIEYLPVPEIYKKKTELFVLENIDDEVKFVRAWAYSGYYRLAEQYPDLRQRVETLLTDALENDPAASVKARIRKLLKHGF
jgi:hypothetical protein